MSEARDGMNWAPTSNLPAAVVKPGEFIFAAAFFNHGHIYGQVNALQEAGGQCKWAWDPDPERLKQFLQRFPAAKPARSYQEILDDAEVQLVAAAAVPCDRAAIGRQALEAGKDYFTDKSPFTTLKQLAEIREVVKKTGKKYFCYFSERLHNEAGYYAGELIRQGAVGDVLQIMCLAPHNLNAPVRPDWFFDKDKYGGILTDIGSHQFEQFLTYGNTLGGKINFARVENFGNPQYPGLEDFGEASLVLDNGISCYSRIDWFNPKGNRTWGDGRTFILGTTGTIEVRKYNDITREPMESQIVYLIDQESEKRIPCTGKVGYPFFGKFVLDVLNRTENAMTQEHVFAAAELAIQAQAFADKARAAR